MLEEPRLPRPFPLSPLEGRCVPWMHPSKSASFHDPKLFLFSPLLSRKHPVSFLQFQVLGQAVVESSCPHSFHLVTCFVEQFSLRLKGEMVHERETSEG